MKPTVHDIAERAGVSLATVDRVLNRRAGVRAPTRARVEAAIAELGYVRDVAAANLARSRTYSFVFIVPSNDNPFMAGLRAEVDAAIGRGQNERNQVRLVEVPPFDAQALVAALDEAIAGNPSGVAFVAIDAPEVHAAVSRLAAAHIPAVTLVSDLPGSVRDHYAGIDNLAAGRTAASLLGRFLGRAATGHIAIMAGSMMVRDHVERVEGFCSVMAAEFPHMRLLPVLEGRDDAATVERLLTQAFAARDDITGIYSLGAGNSGLIRALDAHGEKPGPAVIVHELTQSTRAALIGGTIDAVLNQDAGHEVRSAIRVLRARADGMPVIDAQERIRIDIFLRDNLP